MVNGELSPVRVRSHGGVRRTALGSTASVTTSVTAEGTGDECARASCLRSTRAGRRRAGPGRPAVAARPVQGRGARGRVAQGPDAVDRAAPLVPRGRGVVRGVRGSVRGGAGR